MAKPKVPTKEELERNKRKQEYLNLNGYNVKVDGSWGPWQEEQYRVITTHDKHYPTDMLGALTYLKDKLTNNTTYQSDPSSVTGSFGTLTEDTRSDAKRWIDSQLSDNQTPLGYTYRTLLPAGAIATGLVYGGSALGGAARAVPSVARTVSSVGGGAASGTGSLVSQLMTKGIPQQVLATPSGSVVATATQAIPEWASLESILPLAVGMTGVLQEEPRRAVSAPIPVSISYNQAAQDTTSTASNASTTQTTDSTSTASNQPNAPQNPPQDEQDPNKKKGWTDKLNNLIKRRKGKTNQNNTQSNGQGDGQGNTAKKSSNHGFFKEASRFIVETPISNYGPYYGWRNAGRVIAVPTVIGKGNIGTGYGKIVKFIDEKSDKIMEGFSNEVSNSSQNPSVNTQVNTQVNTPPVQSTSYTQQQIDSIFNAAGYRK